MHAVPKIPDRDAVTAVFAERLREARRAGGWTQEQVAQRAGLDASWIAQFEGGFRAPTLSKFRALVVALGADPAWLLGIRKTPR
jgi:transcriptional regulator with XRE-family HTH domain